MICRILGWRLADVALDSPSSSVCGFGPVESGLANQLPFRLNLRRQRAWFRIRSRNTRSKAARTHRYEVPVQAGQFIHVQVQQRGVDVGLYLDGPDGAELLASDSPNGSIGPESVAAIVRMSGTQMLRVSGFDPRAPAGNYSIQLVRCELLPKKTSAMLKRRGFFKTPIGCAR